jgi:3'-5' exoribonuclease
LADLTNGEEADFFALLAACDQLTTKDGKPYQRVTFRDAGRSVSFPIWSDAPFATACREEWQVGEFYKLRALYRETNFGPQLEIRKIRPVEAADRQSGFDPQMCLPRSKVDPVELWEQLRQLATNHIDSAEVRQLVVGILEENREPLLALPAATRNHHAYAGGFLDHVLSVTRTCIHLADKYSALYPEMQPPLDKDLVVAGGILHDIGKLRELETSPVGAAYTASGTLIGHILQGRDLVREAVARWPLDTERQLRLEHVIVAHQRLPEWGSPKPPMTPEALLVHFADDADAKMQMMVDVLAEDSPEATFTSRRNALGQQVYRGPRGDAGKKTASSQEQQ